MPTSFPTHTPIRYVKLSIAPQPCPLLESSDFLVSTNLMGVYYLLVISSSVMTNEVEHCSYIYRPFGFLLLLKKKSLSKPLIHLLYCIICIFFLLFYSFCLLFMRTFSVTCFSLLFSKSSSRISQMAHLN